MRLFVLVLLHSVLLYMKFVYVAVSAKQEEIDKKMMLLFLEMSEIRNESMQKVSQNSTAEMSL